MSSYPIVTLKPGKDIPVRAGHPWVFSLAIAKDVSGDAGQLVEVQNDGGELLGIGTWNGHTSIRVRMLTRDTTEKIDVAYFTKRFAAIDAWKRSGLPADTNGYRVIHAEADGIPGLILDRYADTFVFQLHTAGMERLRTEIIEAIKETFSPKAIVERSDLEVRVLEGLKDRPVGVHFGTIDEPITFKEYGFTFTANVLKGQKTGFFLDQREARAMVGGMAKDKRVLNLFGYTGAFSVHAAKGGAAFVSTVDASRSALELAQKNFALNGLDAEDEKRCLFLEADVFDLLEEQRIPGHPFDMIICDPPAMAKNEKHIPQATKAYTELNTACLKLLKPGGILVTSSCSGRLDPEMFRSLLRISAGRAGKDVRILDFIAQPIDHAERLAFPEGRYLKTFILEVRGEL